MKKLGKRLTKKVKPCNAETGQAPNGTFVFCNEKKKNQESSMSLKVRETKRERCDFFMAYQERIE